MQSYFGLIADFGHASLERYSQLLRTHRRYCGPMNNYMAHACVFGQVAPRPVSLPPAPLISYWYRNLAVQISESVLIKPQSRGH